MEWFIGLINALASALNVPPGYVGFGMVFATAAFIVTLIGRVTNRYVGWRKRMDGPASVQQAFTTRTPEQVFADAREARREQGCFTLQLILFIGVPVCAWFLFRTGLLDDVLAALWAVVQIIFGPGGAPTPGGTPAA